MAGLPTDEELIDIPEDRLGPGALRRVFALRAERREKEAQHENALQDRKQIVAQRRDEEEHEQHLEFERREAVLMLQIQEREKELIEEAAALDKRTIRLADGRKVFVDGDKYRDEEGRELRNHDRAEAEQLHLEQPGAATWQEHQKLSREFVETEQLKAKVEALSDDEPGASAKLAGFEKDLQAQQKQTDASSSVTDYGSANYMNALGLTGGFNQATLNAPGAIAPDVPIQAQSSAKPKAAAPV